MQDVGELIHLAVSKNQLEIVSKLIDKYNVDPTTPTDVIWPYGHILVQLSEMILI